MGDYIFGEVLTRAHQILFAIYAPLTNSFMPIFGQLLILAVTVYGIAYMYGKVPPLLSSVGTAMVLMTFISMSNEAAFNAWIYEPIFGTSIKLASYVISLVGPGDANSISGVFNALDSSFIDLTYRMQQHLQGLSWYDSAYLQAVCVYGGLVVLFGVLYLAYLALMALSVVSIHVLFVPAGIVMLLGAIRPSRGIFFSWLRTVATYALIPVFASLVLAFGLGMLQGIVAHIASLPSTASPFDIQALTGFFAFPVIIMILFKTPEFASALTGGAASSIGGYFSTTAAGGAAAIGVGAGVRRQFTSAITGYQTAAATGGGGINRAYSAMLGLIK